MMTAETAPRSAQRQLIFHSGTGASALRLLSGLVVVGRVGITVRAPAGPADCSFAPPPPATAAVMVGPNLATGGATVDSWPPPLMFFTPPTFSFFLQLIASASTAFLLLLFLSTQSLYLFTYLFIYL